MIKTHKNPAILSKSLMTTAAIATTLVATPYQHVQAKTTIVDNGKSTFSIVYPAQAPGSIQDAAKELQKNIKTATKAKLPSHTDKEKVAGNYISLGKTKQAEDAGFSSEDMEDDSFRIVTKDGNLYIFGADTPKGEWTKNNGVSNGTANGVYTFQEDYLDVRWLMPGELGRDVPGKSTFILDDIDSTFTPKFSLRDVGHILYYPKNWSAVNRWQSRMRLGSSVDWYYQHNWWKTINKGFGGKRTGDVDTAAVRRAHKEHPEWFAMDENGDRPFPKMNGYKLETTNQELVKWFAEQAIKEFESNERPIAFSLSPSDRNDLWSHSQETKDLLDPPQFGTKPPSKSSLILKWYHDISKIVAEKAPGRMLTGYLYDYYIFPPEKLKMELPDNFSPVIAPERNYGYSLYRKDTQEYFRSIMDSWSEVVTGPWFYYDLPNLIMNQHRTTAGKGNFPGGNGLVTPVAPDILNTIFPQLLKSHINGLRVYGDPVWSSGALHNYVLSKMAWDPTLDAYDVRNEWLRRAYGPDAGKVMVQFYDELNGWFREFYTIKDGRYGLTYRMLKDIYASHYPEMEQLFLQAKQQKMTKVQQRRLELIEDNLIVLQWRLRNMEFLSDSYNSPLQRDDAQISDLIVKSTDAFNEFSGITDPDRYHRWIKSELPWKKVIISDDKLDDQKKVKWDSISSVKQFLIYATKDTNIQISTESVYNGAYFAAYRIKNPEGKTIKAGIFNTEKPISISAKAGQSFVVGMIRTDPVEYKLQVKGAVVANGILHDNELTLSGKSAPIYLFDVPENDSFTIADASGGATITKKSGADVAKEREKRSKEGKAEVEKYVKSTFITAKNKDLNEGWLFAADSQNDGIDRGVPKVDFDDSSWKSISPLDWWQFQGFSYYGPAWYRLKFEGEKLEGSEVAELRFGAIDGNAEIYLNGKKVGEHILKSPDYKGWNDAFSADITQQLKESKNILAVKVTSKPKGSSGIFKGAALIVGRHK